MSTYSPSLRIELPANGAQAGTWGDTTNNNLSYILDTSIAGYQTVSVTAVSQALTYTNGPTSTAANNQSVYAMLRFTTTTGAAFSVYAPPASKMYIVWNNSGQSMVVYNSTVIGNTTAAGTGITISNGNKVLVWSNGTSFYEVQASNLTGTLAIANGGTGQTTANAALNALLPAQTSNANKYLQTDGTNSSWDAISLSTSDITGTLAVANGGTGNNSQTQYGVLYAATTSSLTGDPSLLSFDGTNLGVGTSSPSTYGKLTVLGTGSFTNSLVSTSATLTDKPTLEFRKTANIATTANNSIGRLSFYSQAGSTTTESAYLDVSDNRIAGVSYPQVSLVAYSQAVGTNLASLAVGYSTRLYSQLNITYEGNRHTFTGPVTFNNTVTGTISNATAATTATALSTASGSAPSYSARAWVCFDGTGTVGTNQTILAGGNIATAYKNGSGDYTLTFTTAMQDANYAIQITNAATFGGGISGYGSPYTNPTASAFRIVIANGAGTPVDSPGVYVAVFR